VRLGLESSGEVAILSGIEAGERVVVSAQFLIDSESKLREATAKMMAPEMTDSEMPEMEHDQGSMQHD
jgi:Cu(I)/Ag(I) efflux system membrane fusion protein